MIVCTRNRAASLAAVLDDLSRELPLRGELVVVDQSDPEGVGADALVARWPGLARRTRVLRDPGRGLPRARNVGLSAARAPVVLFLDDDVRLFPGCVAAHLAAYADPGVGGATGRVLEASCRPNARAPTNRLGPGGRVRVNLDGVEEAALGTLKGCSMSFRASALRAVGPCDEGYGGTAFLEDADWSTRVRRAGHALRFLPGAALVHLSAPTGGCRLPSGRAVERARFRNTGRFVRLHRPWSAPRVLATFAAIACKRAAEARALRLAPELLVALWEGWWHADPRAPRPAAGVRVDASGSASASVGKHEPEV